MALPERTDIGIQEGARRPSCALISWFEYLPSFLPLLNCHFGLCFMIWKKINGENQENWNCIGISLASRGLRTVSEI